MSSLGLFSRGITNVSDIFNILHYGTTFESDNELANNLLSRGGMDHQMWTINLILLAVAYGGALEQCGCVGNTFQRYQR